MEEKFVNDQLSELLFKKCPIPKWIYDVDTLRFLAVNDAAVQKYGYEHHEFLSMTLDDIRPTKDVPYFRKEVARVTDPIFTSPGVFRHKDKGGSTRHVQIYIHPVEFEGKNARLALAVDVNEKVIAEKRNSELLDRIENHKKQDDIILGALDEYIWSRRVDNHELNYSNKNSIKVFGYSESEMYANGHNLFWSIIHPDDAQYVKDSMALLYSGKEKKVAHEFRVFHKDGSIKNIASTIVFNKGSDLVPDSIVGVTKDITDLIESENKFRQKAEELDNILNIINDCYFTLDKDWNYTYANDAYLKMVCKTSSDIIGKSIWQVFPHLDKMKMKREYHNAVEQNVIVQFQEYSPVLDIWMSVRAYPTISGLTVCLTNITRQIKLTEKLETDQANLRALVNNTDDLVFSVDLNYNIIALNSRFQKHYLKLTGRVPVVGKTILFEEIGKENLEKWVGYGKRAFNGESFTLIDKSLDLSSLKFLEISINPIFNISDKVIGATCFIKDITYQKNYMDKIEAQNKKLKDIAWIQSHQMRAKVATILGLGQLINPDDTNDPINKFVIDNLINTSEELDVIIREINEKTQTIDY